MNADSLFMRRALELAVLGRGHVSPNPMVGCVIVVDDQVIGEGWHRRYGGPHAEVNAIQSVADPAKLKEAVVYVTLEPCAHHGKTPPCADLLIHHAVKKVVVSCIDTNPLVGGKGIQKLQQAGIEVITGCLAAEGQELNKRFFTFMEQRRPFILLKWAQTADGFIARRDFTSAWISNEYSRQLVHKWRSEEDAVLVGTSTAAHDNPSLTVRSWTGRNPVRIVIDRYGRLPRELTLMDGKVKTICYTTAKKEGSPNLEFVILDEHRFIFGLTEDLYTRKIQSVMIEGGRATLDLFIQADLWDEARIFSSQESFGDGVGAPVVRGILTSRETVFNDSLDIFTPWKK